MIHWLFLLLFLSSAAQAAPIPMPATCKPAVKVSGYYVVPNGATTWRTKQASPGWTITKTTSGFLTGYLWKYGPGHERITAPTNCQIVTLINQFRDKLAARDYSGVIQNPIGFP